MGCAICQISEFGLIGWQKAVLVLCEQLCFHFVVKSKVLGRQSFASGRILDLEHCIDIIEKSSCGALKGLRELIHE